MSRFFALAAVSAVWGGAAAFLFRRLTNSVRADAAKNAMIAHALEIPLYMEEPAIVFRAARELMVANGRLIAAIWLPCLISIALFAATWKPIEGVFSHGALPIGKPAVVTVRMRALDAVQLSTSGDIAVETPPVRAVKAGEVSWRVRPVSVGVQEFRLGCGQTEAIQVPWPEASYFRLPWIAWFGIFSCFGALGAYAWMGFARL